MTSLAHPALPTPGVTTVGGGIASLLLGCELAPHRQVTLVTADSPDRAGGHLASWDQSGYPVEHGFHALFRCYTTALPLLQRHGVPGPADALESALGVELAFTLDASEHCAAQPLRSATHAMHAAAPGPLRGSVAAP